MKSRVQLLYPKVLLLLLLLQELLLHESLPG